MGRPMLAGLCLLSSLVIPAMAQQAKLSLADPQAFRESMLQPSQGITASGTRSGLRAVETLVGLRAGQADEGFDSASIRLWLGASPAKSELCLRIISRDGRYSASGRYRRDPGPAGTPALEVPTRYGDALKAYIATDMAVQAYAAGNVCDIQKAPELFVALMGKGAGADVITAQVNAPSSRIRAQMLDGEKPLQEPVLCENIETGPRIGFTGECRLKIGKAAAGLYTLVLTETTSTGFGQRTSYPVRILWAAGG
jgi:hypothetical protein